MLNITSIQVTKDTALKLQKLKESLDETYEIIIKKLIDFYESNKDK